MNPTQKHVLNKGTYHIFYKTKLCTSFMEGNCRKGDRCTYAHGHHDLRDPPPNWKDLIHEKEKGMNNADWNDDQSIISKMKICWKFYNGEECPYGEKCIFLHEKPMMFKGDNNVVVPPRESAAIDVHTLGLIKEHKAKNVDVVCQFSHGQTVGGSVEASCTGFVHARPFSSVQASLINNRIVTDNVGTIEGESQATKDNNLLKWKAHRKLNGIYADWIDDDSEWTEDLKDYSK